MVLLETPYLFLHGKGIMPNIKINEDYDTFETAYLDICTKLDITPQINRVRAFILLWLERQERYKKL